jgi:AraC-like DNA-binding protein
MLTVTGDESSERKTGSLAPFAEAPAWSRVGAGWRQIFGSFRGQGLSFEWHDFELNEDLDWARSFHPQSVELCLNLLGDGIIRDGRNQSVVKPASGVFYCQPNNALRASRSAKQRHQFITIEFSFDFLRQQLLPFAGSMHPLIDSVVSCREPSDCVSASSRLGSRQQQLLHSLREPPVLAAAQPLWYRTKALELATEFFFESPDREELFCHRQKRLAAERIEKVIAMLRRDLVNPPTLEDIGRAVGCSPFHLSRTFSSETGKTIPQYIRGLRMERAAELLKSGKYNVTEAALEVGYSSLSHFSTAFHQMFGCCPGLYPLKTVQGPTDGIKR